MGYIEDFDRGSVNLMGVYFELPDEEKWGEFEKQGKVTVFENLNVGDIFWYGFVSELTGEWTTVLAEKINPKGVMVIPPYAEQVTVNGMFLNDGEIYHFDDLVPVVKAAYVGDVSIEGC